MTDTTDATMTETTDVPIDALGPTQQYLSAGKLRDVVGWFDFDDPQDYGTLPAFEHDGEWYLADGHTRAFVAHLAGADRFRVERDPRVRTEHDFELYLTCIEWCREAGVRTVPDLAGRVLDPETFECEWVDRCHRASGRAGGF